MTDDELKLQGAAALAVAKSLTRKAEIISQLQSKVARQKAALHEKDTQIATLRLEKIRLLMDLHEARRLLEENNPYAANPEG
jgi:hypothetical protein